MTTSADAALQNRPHGRMTGGRALAEMLRLSGAGTLGPGATNLVTGLIEALNGGIPVVAIAGDINRAHSWKNMTQECRQVEILRPAVKELIRVEDTSRIPELTRRAFAVATSGRPGPVLLDVPEDVCHGTHDFTADDFAIDPATLAP